MLRSCQRFSRTNWYASALKAILPVQKYSRISLQQRNIATLSSVNEDTAAELVTEPLKTLSAKKDFVRCSGFKRYDGQQCSRLVKIDPSNTSSNAYCFHHNPNRKSLSKKSKHSVDIQGVLLAKKALEPVKEKSIFKAPIRVLDCWQLWIGDHIDPKKKAIIKQEMERPISDRDQPGYIYAYRLEEGPRVSRKEYAYFKVGRTTDPHRRMYQVSNTCNYIPKILELLPSFPSSTTKGSLMSTNLQTLDMKLADFPKCPMSHRVERLIHLELSSLYKTAGFKCPGCGSTHREWIRVHRRKHPSGRLMTDHELWLSSIRPIVLRWVQYGVVASALQQVRNSNKPI